MRDTVVVSLRSKGLASFNRATCLDVRYHLAGLAAACVDVIVAAMVTLSSLSWSAWLSIIIMVIVVAVDISAESDLGDPSIFLPFFAYIILPLLYLLWEALSRRDAALRATARLKALMSSLLLQAAALAVPLQQPQQQQQQPTDWSTAGNPDAEANPQQANGCLRSSNGFLQPSLYTCGCSSPATAAAAEELRVRLLVLLDCLYKYLAHKRPYAQHFYLPLRSESQTAGVLVRDLRDRARVCVWLCGCVCD